MSRLLMTYDKMMPTVELTESFFGMLCDDYDCNLRAKCASDVRPEDIFAADVYISLRAETPLSLRLMKMARRAGSFCVYFLDDNLMEPPASRVSSGGRSRRCREMARMADVILSPSTTLCKRVAELAGQQRFARIDTVVEEADIAIQKRPTVDDAVNVVYAAGKDHAGCFEKFVLESLIDVCRRSDKRVCVTFVSVAPRVGALSEVADVRFVGSITPMSKYREFMRESRFDVGVAPLEEDEFSKYKYFNKYIEYSIMGIAGVYTDRAPYTEVVESGRNGLLVKNDRDSWRVALDAAINQEGLACRLAANAADDLRTRFTRRAIMGGLTSSVPELVTSKRSSNGGIGLGDRLAVLPVRRRAEAYVEYFYMTCKYLRQGRIDELKTKLSTRGG